MLAAKALQEVKQFSSDREAKKNIVAAVEAVALQLGNTRAVCRKCYIHPAILDSYLDGSLVKSLQRRSRHIRSSIKLSNPHYSRTFLI